MSELTKEPAEATKAVEDDTTEAELAAIEDAVLHGESKIEAEEQAPAKEPEAVKAEEKPEDGKEPSKEDQASNAEPEPQPTPEGMMPWGAYASMRDKAKKYEAGIAERDAKIEAFEKSEAERKARESVQSRMKPDANKLPDPFDEGFNTSLQAELSSIRQSQFLMAAENEAYRVHGHEVVSAAQAFVRDLASTRPDIQARLVNAANPHVEAVNIHREMEILSNPDAYKQKIIDEYVASQARSHAEQPSGQSQTPAPKIPPNIASVASAAPANQEPSLDDIDGLWGR